MYKKMMKELVSLLATHISLSFMRVYCNKYLRSKGGGSASDSGRSIASSVSTEPFFTGQNVPTETQQTLELATESQTPTQTPAPIENNESNASVNNNEPSAAPTSAEPSTSQAPEVQPEDTNESQDTNELKEQEDTSNDRVDIIHVYSSGDEGK